MAGRDDARWRAALRRAALPGAASVTFEMASPAPGEIRYDLRSNTNDGQPIGDDRDYDLLKAVMRPLENLCTCEDFPFKATLNIQTDALLFETDK